MQSILGISTSKSLCGLLIVVCVVVTCALAWYSKIVNEEFADDCQAQHERGQNRVAASESSPSDNSSRTVEGLNEELKRLRKLIEEQNSMESTSNLTSQATHQQPQQTQDEGKEEKEEEEEEGEGEEVKVLREELRKAKELNQRMKRGKEKLQLRIDELLSLQQQQIQKAKHSTPPSLTNNAIQLQQEGGEEGEEVFQLTHPGYSPHWYRLVQKSIQSPSSLTDEEAFELLLIRNQYPATKLCASSRPLLLFFPYNFGLGSEAFSFSWHLAAAVAMNRTLIVHSGNFVYTDIDGCPSRGLSCFFERMSSCAEDDVKPLEMEEWRADRLGSARVLATRHSGWKDWQEGIRTMFPTQIGLFSALPAPLGMMKQSEEEGGEGTGGGKSMKWVCEQLLKFVLRPNKFMRQFLEDTKARIGFEGPVIGIHIRAERDIKADGRKSFALSEYFGHAEEVIREHPGIRAVFLASDDERLYAQAAELYPSLKVMYFNGSGGLWKEQDTRGSMVTLAQLFLLAESEYLIGALSSNFSTLAKMLAASWGKPHKRVISLDRYEERTCELFRDGGIGRP